MPCMPNVPSVICNFGKIQEEKSSSLLALLVFPMSKATCNYKLPK